MCTGGAFGIVTVEVRTVGGGEPWDHEVAAMPSLTNNTIAQALGNRDSSMQARQGQDYNQLQQTLTFQVCIVHMLLNGLLNTEFVPKPYLSAFVKA